MRRGILGFLFIAGLIAPAAWAQDQADESGQRRRVVREREFGSGGPGGPGGGGPEAMARRVASELELDDAQQAKFDEIVAKYRPQPDADGVDPREKMRGVFEQMREAREAGDDAKVEELRGQMREFREQGRTRMEQMFAEVDTILRDDQRTKLAEMRERFQQRRGPMDMAERADELRRQLNLDDSQRATFDRLAEDLRVKFEADNNPEAWRQRMNEYRSARESGDDARVKEMEAEFEQRRASHEAAANEFYTQLEPILNDDQKQALAQFRERNNRGGRDAERSARDGGVEIRDVIRAAQRIRMDDEQEARFEEIRDAARQLEREARSREARTEAGERVKQQIIEILKSDQKREFEQALTRNHRGGERRPRAERAEAGEGEKTQGAKNERAEGESAPR
ncbi:MAG: Spy/CpxP family protein refolding chaperone [Phycisphaerales bacterium]|nr:Spy/CpxP family protein refolding chaperone [Phycisphaerales bacterium]